MTTSEIINEIIAEDKVDEVYEILSNMIVRQKNGYMNKIAEYRASLNAIRKINDGKNEGIDALCEDI